MWEALSATSNQIVCREERVLCFVRLNGVLIPGL